MKRMIAMTVLLGLLPTLCVAQTTETKVDEATVVGTARHAPVNTSPTTYGAPAAGAVEPGLPPERSLDARNVSTTPTRLEAERTNPGTPGRNESTSWPWKWFLIAGVVVAGAIAASN